MAPELTRANQVRLEEFLAPVRMAVVATVGRTGMPQLTPNWYVYSNGRMSISTTKERVKYRNLVRDPKLAVCVYSEPLAADYVTVLGDAEIVEGDAIWPLTQSIVERYVEPDAVEARMATLRTQNRIIISLRPDRVAFRG